MEAFQALLGDDFCFLLSPHIVARTPRKRPIMTPDHADKMEITVVFQCPPLPTGWEFILAVFVEVVVALISLGEGSAGVSLGWLVTYVTWSRINCYVLTCLMSRAFVSNVTSRRGCPRGCRDSLACCAPSVNDIHIGRSRHPHRTVSTSLSADAHGS